MYFLEENEEEDEMKEENDEEDDRQRRAEAKEKKKRDFNAEYDETNKHYNQLKEELELQSKVFAYLNFTDLCNFFVFFFLCCLLLLLLLFMKFCSCWFYGLQFNKSQFEGLDEDTRRKLEGYRAGIYVRVEFEDVPVEFVEYFEPTKPYIIGGVESAEQNIGAVQVRQYVLHLFSIVVFWKFWFFFFFFVLVFVGNCKVF